MKFNELKEQIKMKNDAQYFSDEELRRGRTNVLQIEATKKNNVIIILDNTLCFLEEKREYRVKIYNIKHKKMNTLYTTEKLKFAQKILTNFKNYKNLSEEEIKILMSGEIEIVNNQTIVKSAYLNKEFLLFDLVEFLKEKNRNGGLEMVQIMEFKNIDDCNYFLSEIKKEDVVNISKNGSWYLVSYITTRAN